MDVKLALCQMIGQQANSLNDLNEKDLVYKQKLCMEILGVANIISPGNIIQQCITINNIFISFLCN